MSIKNILILFVGFLVFALYLYCCRYLFGKNNLAFIGTAIFLYEIFILLRNNKKTVFKYISFKDCFGIFLMFIALVISYTSYFENLFILIACIVIFIIGHRYKNLFKIL
jgi:hypothetical protein